MKPAPGVRTDEKVWDVKAAASEEVGEEFKKRFGREADQFHSRPGRLLLDLISRQSARDGDGGTDGGAASGFSERG